MCRKLVLDCGRNLEIVPWFIYLDGLGTGIRYAKYILSIFHNPPNVSHGGKLVGKRSPILRSLESIYPYALSSSMT